MSPGQRERGGPTGGRPGRPSGGDMSGHPRLAGAVLMIGVVVLLLAISIASIL